MRNRPRWRLFLGSLSAALFALAALPGAALAGDGDSARNGMDWSGYERDSNRQDQDRNQARTDGEDEQWYDPTDWFDDDTQNQVDYDYDDYWFDPTYRMDQGYYTAWEWDTEEGAWVDASDHGDYTTNPVGPYYGDFQYDDTGHVYAGTEYRWNSRSDRWVPVQSFAFTTEGYERTATDEQRQRDDEKARQTARRNGDRQKTVRGTIDGFRHLNLSGVSDQHTLVKLRLENRDDVIVDLGPRTDLEKVDLEKDDFVMVRGRTGTIDGREVLMAKTFSVNGRSHDVKMNRPNRTNEQVVKGKVEDARQMRNGRRDSEHTYLKVKMDTGRSVVIDLGPNIDASDVEISKGDRLAARGRRSDVNGQSIFVARSFVIGEGMTSDRDRNRTGENDRGFDDRGQNRTGRNDRGFDDRGQNRTGQDDRGFDDRGQNRTGQDDRNESGWDNQGWRGPDREDRGRNADDRTGRDRSDWDNQGWMDPNRDDRNRSDRNRSDRNRNDRDRGDQARSDRTDMDPSRYTKNVKWDEIRTSDGQYSFHGFVGDWKKVRTGPDDRDHTLVQLCLEDQRCVVVNLGPDTDLDDLGLEEGDWIWVRGTRKNVNGSPCLVANRINVEGETVKEPSGDYDEFD